MWWIGCVEYFAQFLYGMENSLFSWDVFIRKLVTVVIVLARGGKLGLAKVNQENFIEAVGNEGFAFIKV